MAREGLHCPRSLNVTTAHLIHGYLCAGKTTVARQLEQRFAAVRFSPVEWMISLYGSNNRKVLVERGDNVLPSWSPDGYSIVFQRNLPDERRSDIWAVGANGAGLTRLTDTPRRWEFSPAYSPEGREIAFVRGRGPNFIDPGDIWRMQPTDRCRSR
jgi:dipeptidyl aminopeptidase/acylaminoacyl peptidase